MHSETLIPDSTPTTTNDHDHEHDHESNSNSNIDVLNSYSTADDHPEYNDDENSQIHDEFDHEDEENEIALDTEPDAGGGYDNNPPDSFWVSNNKVTDWLDNHTYIERKASVKLVQAARKFDQTKTRSNQRSVSFNQKPQATIIGFRQKPPSHNADGKAKQNDRQDNPRFSKNRSLPGKSFFQQVAEPRSPRVSCIGRVGSMRGRARRTGFWKTVKTAFLSKVRSNKLSRKDL
ncbi:uncharacterized protein LOC111912132 [Lactuca sativa]|uniref:Uncharacterized protein n=1 Tax=Lactuca sativa TaxID=4236 RepID=A0A9R1UGY7_LACSA|nr:uncharacterized protein LOC111912132 [Lactuca sativa]KAJ0187162.1 hypothetical protein LSAT_V11C900474550 [Lactuca sativa]